MSSPSGRASLMAAAGDVLREFTARAVLLQDTVARSVGLTPTDLQCAHLLLLYGPMTPGELATLTGLTAGGTVTGVVDRLERAGLARRSREPTDRRRVVLTADADGLWRAVGPTYGRVAHRWNAVLDSLTDAQLAFADTLLRRASELTAEEIHRLRRTGDG